MNQNNRAQTAPPKSNLDKIAESSVAIEEEFKIPAELSCGQCIIESAWLKKCPGNNCFGIKWTSGPSVMVTTRERLTKSQLDAQYKTNKIVRSVSEISADGKYDVVMDDRFQAYESLTDCFRAYARLLTTGKNFKDRFNRFLEHGSLEKLLTEMSGSDGKPPYFTGSGYVGLWKQIVGQANVKEALRKARANG